MSTNMPPRAATAGVNVKRKATVFSQANKYLVPATTDDDPNGIRSLTMDVVGHYTQREIEQVMELQAKADAFKYAPQDSEGGFVADNGTDPLYSFQSNLHPIQRILRKQFVAAPDEEEEESMSKMTDTDLKNSRSELLAALAEDSHNNHNIAEERDRTLRTQTVAKDMIVAESATTLLELLQQAQGDSDTAFHVPTAADGAAKALPKRIELKGSVEKQAAAFNSLLKLRNDQVSMLAKLLQVVTHRLEETVNENAKLHLQRDVSHPVPREGSTTLTKPEDAASLLKRIDDLEREQDFLYRRLYGNAHAADVRVDRMKKYRKDVDETYEQMVAAEVAKRLASAVRQGDGAVKQMKEEQMKMRRMLERCTSFANRTQWMLKTAMKSNRHLEAQLMEITLWRPPPPPTPPPQPIPLPLPHATPTPPVLGMTQVKPSPPPQHVSRTPVGGSLEAPSHRKHTPFHSNAVDESPRSGAHTPSERAEAPWQLTEAEERQDVEDSPSVVETPNDERLLEQHTPSTLTSGPLSRGGTKGRGSDKTKPDLPHQTHDALPAGRVLKRNPGSRREHTTSQSPKGSAGATPTGSVSSRRDLKSIEHSQSLAKRSQSLRKATDTPNALSHRSSVSTRKSSSTTQHQLRLRILDEPYSTEDQQDGHEESDDDLDDDYTQGSSGVTPKMTFRPIADLQDRATSSHDLITSSHSSVQVDIKFTPPPPPAETTSQGPVAKQLTKGMAARYNRCCMCAVAVGDMSALWGKCPQEAEAALALAVSTIKAVATHRRGLVAKDASDSALVLFDAPMDAVLFATDVQAELLRLNYAEEVLQAGPHFAACKDVVGRLCWRGLRFAAALTVGCPFAFPHTNVPGSVELGPEILSEDVARALEMALSAHSGDVICCSAFAEELSPFITPRSWATSDKPINAKAFSTPDTRSSSITLTVGSEEQTRIQVETVVRTFPTAAPGTRTSGCAAAGWLDTMHSRLGTKKHNPVAFAAVEVQHASSFPGLSDAAARTVNATAALMAKDIQREAAKHDGVLSITTDCGVLAAFPTVRDAMQFVFSCHARAMHVRAPAARELPTHVPSTAERFVEGVLTTRGLPLRAAVHYDRPTDVIVDSILVPPRYVGPSVDLTLVLGTAARFGETLIDDSTLLAVQRCDEELGSPVYETTATKMINGKSIDFVAIHPKLLRGRLRMLQHAKAEPTPILRVATLSIPNAEDDEGRDALNGSQAQKDNLGRSLSSADGRNKSSDPISVAKMTQRIFRACWTAADRTAKVIGFPVEHDPDPVVADSDLRGAIAEGDATRSAAESVTMLAKIDGMVNDIAIALSCRTERNTRLHHAVQTAIMIAPFDTDDSALYKNSDIGGSVINQRARDNNSPTGVIRRLGSSEESLAMQVSEMRIAALERDNEELHAALAIASQQLLIQQPPGTPSTLAKNRRHPAQLGASPTEPPSPTPTSRGVPPLPTASPIRPRPVSEGQQVGIPGSRGALLSPLQIKYSPVAAKAIALHGGHCSDASLARPFSRGNSRPASVTSAPRTLASRQGRHAPEKSNGASSLHAGQWETIETELDLLSPEQSTL